MNRLTAGHVSRFERSNRLPNVYSRLDETLSRQAQATPWPCGLPGQCC
jgi:hypothetical protein